MNNPLVIGLICALAGTVSYFIFLKSRDKQIAQKAFKSIWIPSKYLEYKDLSGRKDYPEKKPSTQNLLTSRVREILDSSENVLLMSEAMAGKTHFTVNFLKKLENAYVLIPNYDRFDVLFDIIPEAPASANYKIVLLDDIHTYINTGVTRLGHFIENAIENGYIIWANTISGNDFEIVRNNIPAKILSTFKDITIASTLNNKEALKIAKSEGINKLPSHFDGNIGSIFYDVIQVKERYGRLDGIGKLLLLVIKQLYSVGLYRPPAQILKSDIYKLLESYDPHIAALTLSNKIDELKKNGFLLNSQDPRHITFEEKYLRIVIEPDLKVKDFMKSISEIFPNNVSTYTLAMQSARNYIEAEKIYREMLSANVQPSVRPFSVLMGKANDSDIGLTWLKEMDKFGIAPNDFIVNILLRTTQGDVEKKERVIAELELRNVQVEEKIKEMISLNISPDSFTFRILMNLSPDYITGKKLFDKMIETGIVANDAIYGILMKLSNNFSIGKKLLVEMIEKKIPVTAQRFGFVINLAPNFREGKTLFDEMLRIGITPTTIEYGTLIKLAPNYKTGKELFDEMLKKGIVPNDKTYATIINLSHDYKTGKELFNDMLNKGIEPSVETYGTLINLSHNYNTGKELFDEMLKKEIEPNSEIYGTIIKLSDNYKTGKELFDDMLNKGIEPNVETYGTLINLSKNFKTGKELFDDMLNKGIKPNCKAYATIINLSHNYETGKELFDEMLKKEIEPNSEIYGTIIKLSENFKTGKELFDEMINKGIEPSVETYGTLISLSPNYKTGKELFDSMLNKGIEPNDRAYATIINLSRDYKIGKELFKDMLNKGIEPSVDAYGTLINLAHDYETRKKLFDEMIKNGIKPNVEVYTMLIRYSKNIDIGRMHLKEMLLMGIKPNNWTYNSIIWLYTHNYQAALAVMQYEMPGQKLKPDVVTYTELMSISRNFDIAIGLFEEMCRKKIQANEHTLRILTSLAGENMNNQNKLKKMNILSS